MGFGASYWGPKLIKIKLLIIGNILMLFVLVNPNNLSFHSGVL